MFKTKKNSFKILSILFAVLLPLEAATANPITSCYVDVVRAYNKILVGKILVSDEGNQLRFGRAEVASDGRFVVSYEMIFANGRISNGLEALRIDTRGVFLDQITDGVTARRYFASVEEPYHVLRIKPISPQSTDFITRDCIRNSDAEGSVCYLKVRYMNDVIVSEYREMTKRLWSKSVP